MVTMWRQFRWASWRFLPLAASLSMVAFGATSYRTDSGADPISEIQKKIEGDKSPLKFEAKHGYLKSILKELGISPASQTLVFSKTSFQGTHISPKTPRAIYFNDHAYVGWVNGGDLLEIASLDEQGGAVFYTVPNKEITKPEFSRSPIECFACHGSRNSRSVPSLLVRSVYADSDGYPMFTSGGRQTTPQSPFDERWGGWYVTGTHGAQRHMGNVVAVGDDIAKALDVSKGANVTDLKKFFDTSPYLTAESDIVALMVMEHQIQVQNSTARIVTSFDSLDADQAKQRAASMSGSLIDALLSRYEAPLTASVKGGKAFETAYLADGVKDKKGRSLREFDLQTRLYKYRCSPMIYSPVFERLPSPVKDHVYRKLNEVLTNKGASDRFDYIPESERSAIREILMDTKPDFVKAINTAP